MGYFPNGTSGLMFEEEFCQNCVNMPARDDDGCPVWSAHVLYSYELCNEKKHPGKVILDLLIEPTDGLGQRCKMFIDGRLISSRSRARLRTVTDQDKDAEVAKKRAAERPKLVEWPPKEPA